MLYSKQCTCQWGDLTLNKCFNDCSSLLYAFKGFCDEVYLDNYPQFLSTLQLLSLITVLLFFAPVCVSQQAGQLFYISLPSSYSLPTLEAPLPRLPSYESVRKKDRQRQIHMMIADRFGLNGPIVSEVKVKLGIMTVSLQLIQSQML